MLKLYNTLSRKKEIFRSIDKNQVSLYSCGPTIYWYQHIGNLRAYIFSDILKRTLSFNGYKVKHVINITDVGHLTSDADTGEDKIEKAAIKEGKNAKEIVNYYFSIFLRDLRKLNIIEPNIWCKATENIQEQFFFFMILENKGYTYKTKDGIYFDTSRFKDYGKLANLKNQKIRPGKRISLKEKKNPTDFALWKFSEIPGKRQQEWQSPWGIGFPGWAIECSAMSMKYLGQHFDIHTGGEEHIPIHHTNEIAQSEASTGKKFVNYWLHLRWLMFKGEKMSKSKGEIYTIQELENKGINPLSFRYFCLTGHYRTPLEFSFENLENSQNSYNRLKNIAQDLKDDKKENTKYLNLIKKAINNDLDTPAVLSITWKLLRDKKAVGKLSTLREIDKVLGFNLFKQKEQKIPKNIQNLLKQREDYRKEKQWEKADSIRKEIENQGYIVKDTEKGPTIIK